VGGADLEARLLLPLLRFRCVGGGLAGLVHDGVGDGG